MSAIMALDLDGDVDTRREVQFFELIDRLGGRVENVEQPHVGALLEGFLGLLVRVLRAKNGEAFDASWKGDGTCDSGAGAFHGLYDLVSGLVDYPMIKGLQTDTDSLSRHKSKNKGYGLAAGSGTSLRGIQNLVQDTRRHLLEV
jgi:hypothetical protein